MPFRQHSSKKIAALGNAEDPADGMAVAPPCAEHALRIVRAGKIEAMSSDSPSAEQKLSFVRSRKQQRIATITVAQGAADIDLARTALLVVDMQNDFLHAEGWFARCGSDPKTARALAPRINRLSAACRAAGLPVVWVNWGIRADCANLSPGLLAKGRLHGRRPGYGEPSPCGRGAILVRDQWGAAVNDELTVGPDDLLVCKHRFSGFWDNELDSVLRNRDVTTLVFAGINTDRCVFATLTDASFLGYDCILVSDAVATPSPAYVTDAIHFLVDLLYGAVATSDALISALGEPAPNVRPLTHRSLP
jgi:ureidoacrylate peracid hydrolase